MAFFHILEVSGLKRSRSALVREPSEKVADPLPLVKKIMGHNVDFLGLFW